MKREGVLLFPEDYIIMDQTNHSDEKSLVSRWILQWILKDLLPWEAFETLRSSCIRCAYGGR